MVRLFGVAIRGIEKNLYSSAILSENISNVKNRNNIFPTNVQNERDVHMCIPFQISKIHRVSFEDPGNPHDLNSERTEGNEGRSTSAHHVRLIAVPRVS